jgi:outer membrane protein assembly factor BamB
MTDSKNNPPPRSTRLRWFPALWILLLAFACLFQRTRETTQDERNLALQAAFLLGLLGISIWTICCARYSARLRWGLGLAPWLLLAAWLSQFEMINNGDMEIVGWRLRWRQKADQQLGALRDSGIVHDLEESPHDYPGFLGGGHWAEVEQVRLATDWQVNPPKQLWHRTIGAGWSSFAIVGNYAFTQEQRGDNEMVVCYRIVTDQREGEIVWSHADTARFDPSGMGALGFVGPRATPAVHQGRVITQGATGIVNCLDALSGRRLWSHDTLAETGSVNLTWGKSGSPLIVDDWVVISIGAPGSRSLVAYQIESGEEVWASGDRRSSYASPVLAELAGQRQILSVDEDWLTSYRARDGHILWEHPWPGNSDSNASCSQPVPLQKNRVFLSKGYGIGSTLLQIERDSSDQFSAKPLWSPAPKPIMKTKLGNVLVRDGFVYGLDGVTMECIELETGKKLWKKRRRPDFGHGQILLVGKLILILTEQGELVLIEANPQRYRELASLQVFDQDQITWNNPALAGNLLLVRNAREAACYRLPLEQEDETSPSY